MLCPCSGLGSGRRETRYLLRALRPRAGPAASVTVREGRTGISAPPQKSRSTRSEGVHLIWGLSDQMVLRLPLCLLCFACGLSIARCELDGVRRVVFSVPIADPTPRPPHASSWHGPSPPSSPRVTVASLLLAPAHARMDGCQQNLISPL